MSSVEVVPPKSALSATLADSAAVKDVRTSSAVDLKEEADQPDQSDSSRSQPLAPQETTTSTFSLALHEGDEWTLPKLTHNPPPEKYDPVATFVRKACREKAEGVSGVAYKAIISLLRAEEIDVPMAHCTLLTFRRDANTFHLLFEKPLASLLHCILQFNPLRMNSGETESLILLDPFLHLLVAMASAKTVYCPQIFRTLWRMMIYKMDAPKATYKAVIQRLHATIATILRLCPNSQEELFPVIQQFAPHKYEPKYKHLWYYKQALATFRYLPSIQPKVLESMVSLCLALDADIKISETGEVSLAEKEADDEESTKVGEGVKSAVAADSTATSMEQDANSTAEKSKENSEKEEKIDEMADKLDGILYILFQFFQRHPESLHSNFGAILNIFSQRIISTYKSKFVQFLVFYVCGLAETEHQPVGEKDDDDHEPLYRVFVSCLLDMLLNERTMPTQRQTSACYLASFVSRAKYCDIETFCEVMAALLRFAEKYMEDLDFLKSQQYAPDRRAQAALHMLFYTVCQGAFYGMCFRGQEALAYYHSEVEQGERTPEELTLIDITGSRWTKICTHSLRPLQYCLETVKEEFIQLSAILNLVDTEILEKLNQEIIEKTNRPVKKKRRAIKIQTVATLSIERKKGGIGGLGKGENPLDSFFPYDPYLLRESHCFVDPYYRHWDPIGTEDGSANDDDEGTAVITETSDQEEVDDELQNASQQDDYIERQLQSDGGQSDDGSDDESDDDSFHGRRRSRGESFSIVIDEPELSAPRVPEYQPNWTNSSLKRSRAPSLENEGW